MKKKLKRALKAQNNQKMNESEIKIKRKLKYKTEKY